MGIFTREEKEEYIELEDLENQQMESKVPIHVEKIEEYSDSDRIQRKVREGVIMLVNISVLKQKNLPELRRAIERIKRTCDAVGGEVVGAGDDWIIVSPSNAKIVR